MSSASTEDIDPDGDLVLIVGSKETARRFRVSRFALRLASPVWKMMLTGPFAEAKQDEVKLPDDKPNTMRVLLLLVHLQFKRLPVDPKLMDIALLARLCDKYDCAVVAEDRVLRWMTPLKGKAPTSTLDAMAWVWTGWTWKMKPLFTKGTAYLLHQMTPLGIKEIQDLPPSVLSFLIAQAEKTVKPILGLIQTMLQHLERSSLSYKVVGNVNTCACELQIAGALVRLCAHLHLPINSEQLPEPIEAPFAMAELNRFLTRFYHAMRTDKTIGQAHESCRQVYHTIIDNASKMESDRHLVLSAELAKHFT